MFIAEESNRINAESEGANHGQSLFEIACHCCYHRLCHRRDYVLRDLERKNTNNSAVRHFGYHYHKGTYGGQSLGSHFKAA